MHLIDSFLFEEQDHESDGYEECDERETRGHCDVRIARDPFELSRCKTLCDEAIEIGIEGTCFASTASSSAAMSSRASRTCRYSTHRSITCHRFARRVIAERFLAHARTETPLHLMTEAAARASVRARLFRGRASHDRACVHRRVDADTPAPSRVTQTRRTDRARATGR